MLIAQSRQSFEPVVAAIEKQRRDCQKNCDGTFLSVVLNLIVVTAIKEKENSLDVFNVLLANLCLSNLIRYAVRFYTS